MHRQRGRVVIVLMNLNWLFIRYRDWVWRCHWNRHFNADRHLHTDGDVNGHFDPDGHLDGHLNGHVLNDGDFDGDGLRYGVGLSHGYRLRHSVRDSVRLRDGDRLGNWERVGIALFESFLVGLVSVSDFE